MGKVIFSKDAPRKNNLFFSTSKTIPATFLLFNGTGHLLILLGQYQLVGSRYCATVQGWLYFFYMMMKNSRFSVSTGIKKLHSVLKNWLEKYIHCLISHNTLKWSVILGLSFLHGAGGTGNPPWFSEISMVWEDFTKKGQTQCMGDFSPFQSIQTLSILH